MPAWVKLLSLPVSELDSPPPQLIETSVAPRLFAALTAVYRAVLLDELASTSTIFAPGASAWAHSMSSDSSRAQSALVAGRPDGWSISKQAPAWVRDVQVDRAA